MLIGSEAVNESRRQVVEVIDGKPVTRGQLADAFDLVADAANWKNPIDKTLRVSDETRVLIERAVTFFAGCHARFQKLGENHYRVTARGYYLAVGA